MSRKVLTYSLSEVLNGATRAKIDINAGTGNLAVDKLASGEPLLASGTLQYIEGQEPPLRSVETSDGQLNLMLKANKVKLSAFRLPWQACVGAFDWSILISSLVSCGVAAHSDGGNLKLNLAGMHLTDLSADTGGGNIDVALPDKVENLNVIAKTGGGNVSLDVGRDATGKNTIDTKSGGGNVVVYLPDGIVAHIHATTGLGKVVVDSRFRKLDKNTYQSNGYETATDKVEITASSGAGNVSIILK